MDGSGTNNNPNMYVIQVSALSESKYIIADPRSDESVSFTDINLLSNYKQTESNASKKISPSFMIASSWGKCAKASSTISSGNIYFSRAVRRCATYQENGYPAGRWRVPTEAEIEYVATLSSKGLIPVLFGSSSSSSSSKGVPYRSSSASRFYYGTLEFEETDDDDRAAVRCVYDLWYWGDEQDTAHLTTWGGFQTD